ncbi:MAG: Ribosomal small subunit methyltransferase [Gemmatimonadetes bacterium]|nr:Ribosomal small subunit methyltransferase [Gemmatimonadota bacterium]
MDDREPRGGPRPPPTRKSLGQHFLSDPRILARIADAAQVTPGETVVEIGPGRGGLTAQLLERAGRVIAIEVDRKLAELLRVRWSDEPKFEMVERDVLAEPLASVFAGEVPEQWSLVGNVPYYITTPILFHALERPRPSRAVYLVQKEVADRLVAKPGSESYGALSVNVQALATVEQLFKVSPGAFNPPPRVDSAVVRIRPRPDPLVTPDEEARYKRLVIDAFGMRRKQMRRVLREIMKLEVEEAEAVLARANVEVDVRPEVVSPAQFAAILRALP